MIFRAPMRARDRDDPAGAGADWGVEHGVVAIGPGTGERAERLRRRFAELPDGALVWTRTTGDRFFLGRVSGPHRRVGDAPFGLVDQRDAEWAVGPLGPDAVPPAVTATFARGGRNLQRIHGERAERRSAELWEERAGSRR